MSGDRPLDDDSRDAVVSLSIRSSNTDDDIATLMRREGRRTVDTLNRGVSDVDTKASKLMRTNLVLFGLVLGAFSFASDSRAIDVIPFLNSFSLVGMLALVGSTIASGITYTSTETRVGVSPATIRRLSRTEASREDIEWSLARAHARWIEINRRANVRNGFAATVTILLALAAVVLIAAGALVGAYDELLTGWLRFVTWLSVLAILSVIGLLSDVRDDYRKWRFYSRSEGGGPTGVPAESTPGGNDASATAENDQKYNSDTEE